MIRPSKGFLRCVSSPNTKHVRSVSHSSYAKWLLIAFMGLGLTFVLGNRTLAQSNESIDEMLTSPQVMIDTLWVLIASVLIFFMNAGFAMLESGVCRRKNTVNILTKNLIVFSIATLAFWSFGFGIMFGDGNAFFGTQGFSYRVLIRVP